MKKLMLLAAVSLLSTFTLADELKSFDFDGVGEETTAPAMCQFDELRIPDNLTVYAAGGYSGRKLKVQIDQSNAAATQFDVALNSPRRPVALILGAYEPTIWNIGWTRGTYVVAVLASGYHRQAIAGLPSDVPVLVSTHDNSGACGNVWFDGKNKATLDSISQDLFGRPVEMAYSGTRAGKIKVGDPFADGARMLTSADNTPESYYDKDAPPAGRAGLEDAIRRGVLRPATPADADAWATAQAAHAPSSDTRMTQPRLFKAYVILKPFTYPAGLYGANSATFFIAKGVSRPTGNPGHSLVYDFNSMSCSGARCYQ